MEFFMFGFIKKIFYNSKLDFLDVGDIVLAKRYETEEEMLKIEEGHRVSPYIVIRKRFKRVYALECTTSKKINYPGLKKIEFKKKNGYNISKNAYIYVGKLELLNKNRFLNKLGKIDKEDKNRIYKSIYLVNKIYYKVNDINAKRLKFYYEVGDIIKYNKQDFYIYEIDKSYYYLIQVHATRKGIYKINGISYSINFNGIKKIPIKSKVKLINITDNDMKKYVDRYLYENMNKNNNSNVLCRGKLIKYENNFYYIYGEYQDKLLLYKVYLDKYAKSDMTEIYIKRGYYYTYFEECEIKNNLDVEVFRKASVLEMDNIKKLKNFIKKENKEVKVNEKIIYKDYKAGYIMMNDDMDRYIIIKRRVNTIVYMPLDDLEDVREYTFSDGCVFDYSVLDKMDKYKYEKILKDYNERINKDIDGGEL